jgi:hypothetical protein
MNGTVTEGLHEFHWTISNQPWLQDSSLELLTAEVKFSVGGRECAVRLNTLAHPPALSSGTTMTAQ